MCHVSLGDIICVDANPIPQLLFAQENCFLKSIGPFANINLHIQLAKLKDLSSHVIRPDTYQMIE